MSSSLVPGEGPRGHEIIHHVTVLELVLDYVCMLRACLLKKSLEVVCWWPCLALATACGSRDVLHVGVIRFLFIIVVVGHGSNPLRVPLSPLLAALASFLVPWMVMLDGATLVLLGATSLPPGIGRGLATSLLVTYWMAMLSSSLVVYLKMSFNAWKGSICCVLLPNAFVLGPLGPRQCPFQSLCPPHHGLHM
jgi:hypothetical protein